MKQDYDYDQLYPGRFIKSGEFKGKSYTFTIRDVDLEELESRKGKKMKCVVSFAETKKMWVAPKTCGECLKGLWGRKVSGWIGKRVTLYVTKVQAFGKMTDAIRVLGSPDLEKDTEIMCKAGSDDPFPILMKKTQVGGRASAAPTPAEPVALPPGDIPRGADDAGAPWNKDEPEAEAGEGFE